MVNGTDCVPDVQKGLAEAPQAGGRMTPADPAPVRPEQPFSSRPRIIIIEDDRRPLSGHNGEVTRSTLKNTRRGLIRLLALTAVVSMPLAGVASATPVKSAKGSAAWCADHPTKQNKPICTNSAGGGGTGSGAPAPTMVVTASPNPVMDTGAVIMTVVQVETSPAFAGDSVIVSSSQLANSCLLVYFIPFRGNFGENVVLTLDNDGNATVEVVGEDCAPGPSVIEADMMAAPYYTATTILQVLPPAITPAGLTGYPNPEVEVGDTNGVGNNDIGNSDVFAVFEIETSPVYAEQPVEIDSTQLDTSCGEGWVWISPDPTGLSRSGTGLNTGLEAQALLDDDGNAVFGFFGKSCAAGTAQVIADVEAGTHSTYVTAYTVDPPAPTI